MHTPQPNHASLTIRFFGGFEAELDDVPITAFESDRERALLAYLAIERGKTHTREHLAGLFWPEFRESRARHNLSQALYHLKTILEDRKRASPLLLATRATLRLNPNGSFWSDVAEFENLQAECARHAHPYSEACTACNDRRTRMVGLYAGELIAGFGLKDASYFEAWLAATRERLHRQAILAVQRLVEAEELAGKPEPALSAALKWAAWDPYSEDAACQVMELLAQTGQHNAALYHFSKFKHLLQEELGVEPGLKVTRQYEAIRDDIDSALLHAPRHNLPDRLTRFVGRTIEIQAVKALLNRQDNRLISLVGPGGSGKTSLAVEAARSLLDAFPDGVYFVPLGAVAHLDGIPPALAETLGLAVGDGANPETLVQNYLNGKNTLLVLDGFEQLVPGSELIGTLLHSSPGLKVLVTSRVKLNTRYEVCYTLGGMELPEPGTALESALASDSVQLFQSSASRAGNGFEIHADNLEAVIRICTLVQGMPLGLLLAAAWVSLLTPVEIADKIQRSLDFLVVDWQDLPERLRSLRATFNYSWELLGERERAALQGLSVFRGGFNLPAAEEVTGASLRDLSDLMDKSFLQRGQNGRFEIHELVRQYAAEKLGQRLSLELETRNRHSTWYLELVGRQSAAFKSPDHKAALVRIETDFENIHLAWHWAIDHRRADWMNRACDGLGMFLELRGRYQEGELFFGAAVEAFGGSHTETGFSPEKIKALVWHFYFICLQFNLEAAGPLLAAVEKHLELARGQGLPVRFEQGLALFGLGQAHHNLVEKQDALLQALEIFLEIGETWWAARALWFLGISQNRMGNYPQAVEWLEQSIALWREVGDPDGLANCLRSLCFSYMHSGRLEETLKTLDEATQRFYAMGTWNDLANADSLRGLIYMTIGRMEEGASLLDKSLAIFQRYGLRHRQAFVENVLGMGRMHLGQFDLAWEHARRALQLAQSGGIRREEAIAKINLGNLQHQAGDLESALQSLQGAVAIYRKIHYVQELDVALANLGLALRRMGEHRQALEALCEALHLNLRSGSAMGRASLLPLAALLALDMGEIEFAWQIWEAGELHPIAGGSHWVRQIAAELLETPHPTAETETDPSPTINPGGIRRLLPRLVELFNCPPPETTPV